VASILLVDDNDQLRSMIERGLKRAGHEVLPAVNGRSALAILPKVKFDLILTDIVMPDMEGLELIRSIRKMNSAAKIIAMSGGGRGTADDYLTMAKNFGAAATLEKPFDLDTLTRTVAEVLDPAK
jgi:two-component system response regulator (stage 0 sporulation protein F)